MAVGLPGVLGVGPAAAGPTASVSTTLSVTSTTVASGAGFTVTAEYACASVVANCTGTYMTVVVPATLNAPSNITNTNHIATSTWTAASRTLRWNFVEPLPAGTTGQVNFVTSFLHGPTGNGATVSLSSTISSTNAGSANSAAVTVTATASSSWGAQFATPVVGALSQDTTYQLRVVDLLAASSTNRAYLLGYTLNAAFPAGTTFVSASNGGSWSGGSSSITWSVSNLTIGSGSATAYVSAVVRYPVGTFANAATVTVNASGTGVIPAATGTKSVALTAASYSHRVYNPSISITMSKTVSTSTPAPGTSLYYRITTYNSGNVPTTMQVVDVLPDGTGILPGGSIGVGDTRGAAVAIFYSTASNPRTTPSWQRLGGATATYTGTSSSTQATAPNPLPGGATRITALRWDYQAPLPISQQYVVDVYVSYNALTDAGATIAAGTLLRNCANATGTYSALTGTGSACVNGSGGAVVEALSTSMVQSGGTPAPGQYTRWTSNDTNSGNVPLLIDAAEVFPDGTRIPAGGRIGIGDTVGRSVQIYYSTAKAPRTTPVWTLLGTYSGSSQTGSFTTAPASLPGGATGITALRYVFTSGIDVGRNFTVANDLQYTNVYDDGTTVPTGAVLQTCLASQYGFTTLTKSATACASVTVPPPYTALQPSNWLSDGTGANPGSYPTVALGGTAVFPLKLTNTTNSWYGVVDPVLTTVVPSSVLPGGASWAASSSLATAAGLTYNAASDFATTALSGGRTSLRWRLHGTLAVGATTQVNLTIKVGSAPAGVNVGQTLWASGTFTGTPTCNSPAVNSGAGAAVDTENVLGFGVDRTACTAVWGHRPNAVAAVDSGLWVKGAYDAAYSKYPSKGQTVAGGQADYRLILANTGTVSLKNLVVVDILPYVGDIAVVTSGKSRGSQYSPNLAGAVETSDPAIKVWYSTAKNPCRPEVGISTGCTAANWMSVVPSNPTVVKSLKLDFTTTVVAPGQQIQFDWPMRVPSGTPTGATAWNSIGYTVTRTDNNDSLLPSEPMMTGLSVLPPQPNFIGDRVWSDANLNGVQDSKEGGINGIKVRLYRGTDSALVATTITGNNYAGKPGYYQFANLADGSYYVVFDVTTIPSGAEIVPAGQGSDRTLDSDADPTTGRTVTFTVAGQISDFTRDMGVYVPQCDTITC